MALFAHVVNSYLNSLYFTIIFNFWIKIMVSYFKRLSVYSSVVNTHNYIWYRSCYSYSYESTDMSCHSYFYDT